MTSDRHVIATYLSLLCFVAIATVVPSSVAQQMDKLGIGARAVPLDALAVTQVQTQLAVPGVIALTSTSLNAATDLANVQTIAKSERDALTMARDRFEADEFAAAEKIAAAVVQECEKNSKSAEIKELGQRARILLANARLEQGDAKGAMKALPLEGTPINDYVLWIRARAFSKQGKHAAAAEVFEAIVKLDTRIQHHATVHAAHELFAAGNWAHAAERLNHVVQTYPDYPRRHQALYEHAVALDKLGKDVDAADAYLQTHFEFPYRNEGKLAKVRLDELQQAGTAPSKMYSRTELYQRYRRLRINKHWDVARALFTQLAEDHATPEGNSEFEHDIAFQLALNDYGSRAFTSAIKRLNGLVAAYEAGNTDGIWLPSVYKYLSRSHSRMGNVDEAMKALEKEHARESQRSQLFAKAEFLEEHGQFRAALKIYDELRSAGQKRGWSHTWLLYLAGQHDAAFENLMQLAERSSGQRRAKYLYWAGRTLENAGKSREAKELYRELAQSHGSRYYGFQAKNRILDVDQGRAKQPLLANAEQLSNAADHVLDAMDEAELALGASRAEAESDPRAQQRDNREVTIQKPSREISQCEAEVQAEVDFCRMEVGDLPEPAIDVMRAAFTSSTTVGSVLAAGLGTEELVSQSADNDDIPELDSYVGPEPSVPLGAPGPLGESLQKTKYTTPGRIHWNGRFGSTVEFAKFRKGELFGPLPKEIKAYDEEGYIGGIDRAAKKLGKTFPELVRAAWLYDAGMHGEARWAVRHVSIEFRELSRRWRAGAQPHALDNQRWSYYIDNRRKDEAGMWGLPLDELRYPVPENAKAKAKLLARQQAIYDGRVENKPIIMNALKEIGDHFMVRKMTLGTGGWYRRDPTGPSRPSWMQAYPRAFPELVMREAKKNGLNPYVLWALMTVESSYNPDSVSPADALGLLQVIPKTGLKTALMLGDTNFGPHDLLEAENAVKHGAFYFGKLLHKFHGQELLAFAGYNGGPHRVGDWLDMRGDKMTLDEFIETIPFDEARGYAKKVSRFVALYLRIYEGHDGLYIGQNLRADYKPHPKF